MRLEQWFRGQLDVDRCHNYSFCFSLFQILVFNGSLRVYTLDSSYNLFFLLFILNSIIYHLTIHLI